VLDSRPGRELVDLLDLSGPPRDGILWAHALGGANTAVGRTALHGNFLRPRQHRASHVTPSAQAIEEVRELWISVDVQVPGCGCV
jgi:hypothetical protein